MLYRLWGSLALQHILVVDHHYPAVLFFAPDPFVTQWQDRFTVFFKGYFFLGFAYRTTEDDVHSNTDINFQSMNKSCPG